LEIKASNDKGYLYESQKADHFNINPSATDSELSVDNIGETILNFPDV